MKKKLWAVILPIVVFLVIFMAFQTVFAANRYYTVDKYLISIDIQPDGSANIEEKITYRFSGSFNGILRNVDYQLTDGMKNIQVFAEKDGSIAEFKVNSTTDLDADGSPGTYNLVNDDEIAQFKVYEKSSNETKSFIFKYTFLNVVTKYNDIAEFNRRLVDIGWDVPLSNIEIDIRLPGGAKKEDIRVFGHGPLTGESKIIDERNVRFSVDYITPGQMVETLVLFPTGIVPQSSRIIAADALPTILENEKRLAEEANAERERARRQVEEYKKREEERERQLREEEARRAAMRPFGNALGIVLVLSWFAVIIYIYIKYDKELKHSFEGRYYRELPGEYTPAEMSVLITMGSVGTRDITATLLDLVRKEQLLLKTETYIKDGFFRDKEVEDYLLSINPDAPAVYLKKHEAFLIDWFIGRIGNGNSVFLDEISARAKTTSGARRFLQDYKMWCELAKNEAEKNKFFDETCNKGRVIGILASLAYFAFGFLLAAVFRTALGYVLPVLAFILLIFAARIKRRTSYGNEQNAMWQAFKNFLKDFSRLDKAEIPSIVIWEHYLVYAVSLGVAKEVIKQLPLVFGDEDLQNTRLTYMRGYHFHNFASFANAFDKTINSVDSSISRAIAVANSKVSSSSGGGGGFSGGSSGGGGGRGGGGAF
jgi:uncharacterized membrane protein